MGMSVGFPPLPDAVAWMADTPDHLAALFADSSWEYICSQAGV